MAEKRMFSAKIIESDAFLDIPAKWDHPRCLTGANKNKNVEVALHKEDDLEGQMDISDFPEVMP